MEGGRESPASPSLVPGVLQVLQALVPLPPWGRGLLSSLSTELDGGIL